MLLQLLSVALPWTMVAVGCWIGYQLVRQNGRILLRLEALERHLQKSAPAQTSVQLPSAVPAPLPPGLPLGSLAPPFDLPDLDGCHRSLKDFRGRRALLIFFNPQCGFCVQMAPELAVMASDTSAGRPLPFVISTGSADGNRAFMKRYGIATPVLLQREMEVATLYQAGGTPMGYVIDEEGCVASGLAVGAQAVLALSGPDHYHAGDAVPSQTPKTVHHGNKTLADSSINRSGLTAGTPAPAFRLPQVGGGELSLERYRGQPVLLVFSDPHCGPCDHLAPQLEQVHRERPDLQVLMISRGDLEENRQKIAQHGLTFPVVLQRQWEISKLYGMFATPIGYLVDNKGILAADVASGADAILALTKLKNIKSSSRLVPQMN